MDRIDLIAQIEGTPVEGSPDEMRAAFERRIGVHTRVPVTSLGKMPGRMFGAGGVKGTGGAPVLWLHGGGYIFGSSTTHAAAATYLAEAAQKRVFVADYPLSPEASWEAILSAVVEMVDETGPVAVVGDSAGGHLAIALALARPESVTHLGLISPNTDRSGQSTTRIRNSRQDVMNDDDGDRALGRLAMPDIADDDPRASPLLADLSGLPPCFLTAATNEVLLDDTLLFARALGLAGVAHETRIERGLFHLWPVWPHILPEARATLTALAAYLR